MIYLCRLGRANQDPALKELGTNPTDIQIAAKQTGFLQRHVSHKAERQHNLSSRLNEDNLNSLEPRKEQRIDPKGGSRKRSCQDGHLKDFMSQDGTVMA